MKTIHVNFLAVLVIPALVFLQACGDSHILSEESVSGSNSARAEENKIFTENNGKDSDATGSDKDQNELPPEDQTAYQPVDISGAWLIRCSTGSTGPVTIGCHLVSETGQRHPAGASAAWKVSDGQGNPFPVAVLESPGQYQQDFVFQPSDSTSTIMVTATLPEQDIVTQSTGIDLEQLSAELIPESEDESGPDAENNLTEVIVVAPLPQKPDPAPEEAAADPACAEFDDLSEWRQDTLNTPRGTRVVVTESRSIYLCIADNGGMNFCGFPAYEPEEGSNWQNAWELVAVCPESRSQEQD